MRLVDVNELMHRFMDKPPDYYHTSYIVGEINIAPTVDAVPVVRCVNCEHFRPTGTNLNGYWFCQSWDMDMLEEATDPKRFYCADGKEKTYGEGHV